MNDTEKYTTVPAEDYDKMVAELNELRESKDFSEFRIYIEENRHVRVGWYNRGAFLPPYYSINFVTTSGSILNKTDHEKVNRILDVLNELKKEVGHQYTIDSIKRESDNIIKQTVYQVNQINNKTAKINFIFRLIFGIRKINIDQIIEKNKHIFPDAK